MSDDPENGWLHLMELPCPECDESFMFEVPDEPPGTVRDVTITCSHCGWEQTTEMEYHGPDE